MTSSTIRVLLFALLCLSFTSAALLPKRGNKGVGQAFPSRQMTRSKLLSKIERKKSFVARDATHRLAPRQSATPAVTCGTPDAGPGYAVYRGYVTTNPDITGRTRVANGGPQNVSACAAYCEDFGSECVGFIFGANVPFYGGASCALKGDAAGSAAALNEDSKWDVYIEGSCNEYSSETDVSCCNSAAYDSCGTDTPPDGWVRYSVRAANSPGNNLADVTYRYPESDCRQYCDETAGCYGYSYRDGSCSLKGGSTEVILQLLNDDTNWATTVRAENCGVAAAHMKLAVKVDKTLMASPLDIIGSPRSFSDNSNLTGQCFPKDN